MRAAAFALLIQAAIAGGVTEEATPAPHDDAAATSDACTSHLLLSRPPGFAGLLWV